MAAHTKGKPVHQMAPTVAQIKSDVLTQFAGNYWTRHGDSKKKPFDPAVVNQIYKEQLLPSGFAIRRIMLLEFSQYLENFLWPNFDGEKSSDFHVLSICIMVNEKYREKISPWDTFIKAPKKFADFFNRVMSLAAGDNKELSVKELCIIEVFLIRCFNSLERDIIREQIQKLISLPIWECLLPGRLEIELKNNPRYQKYWNGIKKKDSQLDKEALQKVKKERRFLSKMITRFFGILESIPATGPVDTQQVQFCERFVELMIDLEALLPTRRFFNTLLDDHHVVVRCRLSNLSRRMTGSNLFNQLVEMLKFYAGFEINDISGCALTDDEMTELHYSKITSLQRAAFKHFKDDLMSFALSNVANVDTREALTKHFDPLSIDKLHAIAAHLQLVPPLEQVEGDNPYTKEFLLEMLISRHERRPSQIQRLNTTPLYPTEEILWNEHVVPSEYYSGEGCLALPKLNLQFLTLHDYLLRNHDLFQLESTYEIRQDIEDSVSRLKPWVNEYNETLFAGWARMAQPIENFSVIEIGKPNLGDNCPSRVRADVSFLLNKRDVVRDEWQALRKHDVCLLLTIRSKKTYLNLKYDRSQPFQDQYGVAYVRGCEIEGMLGPDGKVIEEGPDPKPEIKGDSRTFRILLDCNQYQLDLDRTSQGAEDVYSTFNVILRRKPKENNFKAVLETIRDLMNTNCLVPDWIQDTFLGYDDPGAAHYSRLSNQIQELDFCDTFLDFKHLEASFPKLVAKSIKPAVENVPPFRVTFPKRSTQGKRKADETDGSETKELVVVPHVMENRGPYPYSQPKKNSVRFTPTQVEAIHSGMQPGLTMVVGPPGTGKTDVAVQIISNIYHNFPEQRTLIVTHSNQALNQLFEKIMCLDIDERHLLRLGHGEETLETEKDFSRYGRVNYVLARRLYLLKEVQRLQDSLDVHGDVSYTCETAGHFFLYRVISRWEEYQSKLSKEGGSVSAIASLFPFTVFFANAPQPIFQGKSFSEDREIAEGCYRHIKAMFEELEEYRAFELLRNGIDRSKYLLIKTAKIIAMTCTHAALKRRDLVELSFKYDNVLMEEAAQILEVETFIPLMLQNPQDGYNRLKRVILIGDHHQLPPVIKNMSFQKFSNLEQSLFTRFVRLGVPYIELDAQGRARPSLCALYSWKYDSLGNLPHVTSWPEYCVANPGFGFDYQLIDVEDFNGVGESEPNPYFYQNLAEAEYCVALFMYMRLLGYPADKISILTTYNGQKHLIRDVIDQRCGENPLIGKPHKITTVDRYQGQQNDYIILSLVRTKAVGHLRDVRRLVVAMSRARLGLYIFARVKLFQDCYELTPVFNQLMKRPKHLMLAPWETYPSQRPSDKLPKGQPMIIRDMPQLAAFVYDFYMKRVQELEEEKKVEADLAKPPVETVKVPEEKEEEMPEVKEENTEDDLIVNEVEMTDDQGE